MAEYSCLPATYPVFLGAALFLGADNGTKDGGLGGADRLSSAASSLPSMKARSNESNARNRAMLIREKSKGFAESPCMISSGDATNASDRRISNSALNLAPLLSMSEMVD
jgi:hypothetical protein